MNEDSWLRDALHKATDRQPRVADRVTGVFATVSRRRQRRAIAASFVTVVAVAMATFAMRGDSGVAGLNPIAPVELPSGTATAEPSEVATPPSSPEPEPEPEPVEDPDPAEPNPGSPAGPVEPGAPVHGEKLDVYVLVDTSFSMDVVGGMFREAVPEIAARLARNRVDAQWGVGTFTDTSPSLQKPDVQAYRRITRIGPGGLAGLNQVDFQGGDSNEEEAHTLALQGALGIGHAPYTTDQDAAGFRPGARRVVLLVTDAPMQENDPKWSIAETIRVLSEHDVTVVALQAITANDADAAYEDLSRVVAGTGGTATTPVDCDGDGPPDVGRGEPLVCALSGGDHDDHGGLGDAITDLVRRG